VDQVPKSGVARALPDFKQHSSNRCTTAYFVKLWFVKTKKKWATLDDSGPLCIHSSRTPEPLQDGHDATGRGQQRAPSKQNRIMADQ